MRQKVHPQHLAHLPEMMNRNNRKNLQRRELDDNLSFATWQAELRADIWQSDVHKIHKSSDYSPHNPRAFQTLHTITRPGLPLAQRSNTLPTTRLGPLATQIEISLEYLVLIPKFAQNLPISP